ncbi:divergent protein kinase domain 2B-like [Polyodon spathula]|uniref:divergent protein kinase domain 2B-like n=1 Tax=Polyodon spathula TaxID=7913 RepID=UPI001B7EE47B|nr:divergent protein kinase domain 2B-like [Polyodon spathula]
MYGFMARQLYIHSLVEIPSYKKSYPGNYTDDSENWRLVVVSHLLTKYNHDVTDMNICTSAAKGVTRSIENMLRSTRRFQKWTSSNLLTPNLVQGLSRPMLRCPSQSLLDRIVHCYTKVLDEGSILMKHFTDHDKLRLLYTLAVNQHPIMLQNTLITGPFVRYYRSCGRMMVSVSASPIRQFYSSSP